MKKIILVIATLLCIFFVILFLSNSPGNCKLMLDEIVAWFKPTIHLDCSLNVKDIKEVEVFSRDHVYTDKKKITKLIDYLNEIPMAEANRDELPNKSADTYIAFYSASGRDLGGYALYGEIFILDLNTKKLYRSKKGQIIEGVENLNLDLN